MIIENKLNFLDEVSKETINNLLIKFARELFNKDKLKLVCQLEKIILSPESEFDKDVNYISKLYKREEEFDSDRGSGVVAAKTLFTEDAKKATVLFNGYFIPNANEENIIRFLRVLTHELSHVLNMNFIHHIKISNSLYGKERTLLSLAVRNYDEYFATNFTYSCLGEDEEFIGRLINSFCETFTNTVNDISIKSHALFSGEIDYIHVSAFITQSLEGLFQWATYLWGITGNNEELENSLSTNIKYYKELFGKYWIDIILEYQSIMDKALNTNLTIEVVDFDKVKELTYKIIYSFGLYMENREENFYVEVQSRDYMLKIWKELGLNIP